MAFYLAPFATEESRESVRRNANFHALYFTICHGMEAGKAAVHNLAGIAQSHGYRVALAQSRLVTLNRAEDVMGPGERPVADARPPVAEGRPLAKHDRSPEASTARAPAGREPRAGAPRPRTAAAGSAPRRREGRGSAVRAAPLDQPRLRRPRRGGGVGARPRPALSRVQDAERYGDGALWAECPQKSLASPFTSQSS